MKKGTLEKAIEQKFIQAVKRSGGIAPKFVAPGFNGMPDRLVLFPGGRLAFAEIKAPGKKPRALQLARHELLRKLGFCVFVLDDVSQIEAVIKEVSGSEVRTT